MSEATVLMPFAWRALKRPDGVTLRYRIYDPEGEPRRTLVCLHGLTRSSADFHAIAQVLALAGYRVLSLDFRGRGASDWDPQWRHYHVGTYIEDTFALLEHEALDKPVAFGTSLGGLVTMWSEARKPGLWSAAILNDIGPEPTPESLGRIQAYVGVEPMTFPDWDSAVQQVRLINEPAHPAFTDSDWMAMTRRICEEHAGGVRFAYDPHIGDAARSDEVGIIPDSLVEAFEALSKSPVLVLRGAISDLLSPEKASEMSAYANVDVVEVPGVGHAPTLEEPEAQKAVLDFLKRISV